MIDIQQELVSLMPPQVLLFADTRLEKLGTVSPMNARLCVTLPFLGATSGRLQVWCNLNLNKLKPNEEVNALGVLTEASNILAGMVLSELADEHSMRLMLAPPQLSQLTPARTMNGGTDYRLHLLSGHCDCKVVIQTGVTA